LNSQWNNLSFECCPQFTKLVIKSGQQKDTSTPSASFHDHSSRKYLNRPSANKAMDVNLSHQFIPLFATVFIIVWIVMPHWIKRAQKAGLMGKDIHKNSDQPVAEMGGIVVLLGFLIGIMGYVAMRIFMFKTNSDIVSILAILTAVLIAGVIGIIDDILGWKIGLRQWQKPLLTLLVAAPIMAINAGTRTMMLPFLGQTNLGMIYPLIIIPILIVVSTNGFNMLAGYNGLETGMGIIILTTLAYLAATTGSPWIAVVALCMVAALMGMFVFNKYPSSVFPGDTLTYTVGALIGIMAITANLEKIFIILFIPYILEFFLKLRGRFQKESFAQIQEDGTLKPRYAKNYGLEHLAVRLLNKLRIKTNERKVVYLLYGFQLCFVVIAIFNIRGLLR